MKILFILGTYLPKASANGICVMNLIQELKKSGHEIHCLCWDNIGLEKEDIDEVHIERVKVSNKYKAETYEPLNRMEYKMVSVCDRLLASICLPLYPNHHIGLSKRMMNKGLNMMEKYRYDCVVSVFQPFDALYAGYEIKRRYPNKKWILYYLDVFSGGVKPSVFTEKKFFEKTFRWERRFMESCDCAIIMDSYKKHYTRKEFNVFEEKIRYADFPLLNGNTEFKERDNVKQVTNFLLAGKIDYAMRNPEYLLNLMEQVLKIIPSHFDFCGTLDWFDLLKKFENKVGDKFTYHGKVDYCTAQEMESEADVVINIGNSFAGAVPSKIFSYMAKGKMILHISPNDNDSSIIYLKEYPKALIIRETDMINDELISKIQGFIEKNSSMVINSENLKRIFEKNIPQYTSNIIEKCLENK